jgi:hypothetical protein
VEDIAIERGLTAQTVINHLTWYIGDGQLDKASLIDQSIIDEVTKVAMVENSGALTTIHAIFDGKYSYNEIRIALIGLTFNEEKIGLDE